MTSIPRDPFNNVDVADGNRVIVFWGPDYIQGGIGYGSIPPLNEASTSARSAIFFSPYPEYSDGTNLLKRDFWVLFSLGPDRAYDILYPVFPSPMIPYDPTNGTVSKGDVVRFKS